MSKIVLASSSPRRREILEKFGMTFSIEKSNIKEMVYLNERPEQVAMALAFEKAYDISNRVTDDKVVLAADTIVFKDEILGKPENHDDAFNMLLRLNGKIHQVFTGFAIIKRDTNTKIIDYDVTQVKFRLLDEASILNYLQTGEYKDKAGAYAIQGYGELLVEWISGSYSNVVGLPIVKIESYLKRYFDIRIL